MKLQWFYFSIGNSVSSYDLPTLKNRKKCSNSIRLSYLKTRNTTRKKFNSFHHSCLTENYNKNLSSLFLTYTNSNNNNNQTTNQSQYEIPSPSNTYGLPFRVIDKSPFEMYFSDIGFNRNSDYLCKNQSANSLLLKAKSIMKSNYIKSIQNSQYVDLAEEKKLRHIEYDLRLSNLKNGYMLFLEFLNQQTKYLKYLYATINEQKTILVNQEEQRQSLDKEIRQLKEVISKKQKYISKAIEYKEFLLKVKHVVPQIKDLPKEELIKHGYATPTRGSGCGSDSRSESNSNLNILKELEKGSSRKHLPMRKRNSIFKPQPRKSILYNKDKDKENQTECVPIFLTTDEFNHHLKKIEKNTFQLFQEYTTKNEEIIALERERDQFYLSDLEQNNKCYIDRLIEEKGQLVFENKRLINILQKLKNPLKKEEIRRELTRKLKEILISIPVNIEKEFNETNFYHILKDQAKQCWVKGIEYNIIVYLIQVLEKILVYYSLKIKQLSKNPYYKGIIYEIKKNIEKKKRILNNKRNRDKEILRKKELYIQIILKNMRPHLKKRGLSDIFIKTNKNKESKHRKNTEKDLREDYAKLLTY